MQLDSLGKRTRLIKKSHQKHSPNMQSIMPLKTEGFVDEMLSQMKPQVVCGAVISESPSRAYRSSTGMCVCV